MGAWSSSCCSRTKEGSLKNDFTYLAIFVAFFAVSILLVIGCDRIIGSDEEALAITGDEADEEPEALETVAS